MKFSIKFLSIFASLLLFLTLNVYSLSVKHSFNTKIVINSISGQIWDPYNNPVPNIDVELQNELMITVSRQRTSSAGLYRFSNISAGSYKVRVLTVGTDYLDQTQDVQIVNLVQGGSDSQYLDFRLRFDPRKVSLGSGGLPEEVFAQEGITKEAEKRYRKGIELLAEKKDAGLIELEEAIKLFPNYFYALNRLGKEYVQRREFRKSLEYLIRAIDINQKSYSSYYALGYACYQLNEIPEAIEAARAATILKPGEVNAHLLYGTILRINGNYELSEKSLLQAQKLSKKPVSQIHWQLALLYNKANRNKEAAEQLEIYLRLEPNTPDKDKILSTIEKLRSSATR